MGVGVGRLGNYASFAVTSIAGLLRCTRPDFLFIESPPLSLAVPGVALGAAWGARTVLNVADLWPDSVREFGVLRDGLLLRLAGRLESWAYRHVTFLSAVTA